MFLIMCHTDTMYVFSFNQTVEREGKVINHCEGGGSSAEFFDGLDGDLKWDNVGKNLAHVVVICSCNIMEML